MGEVGNPATGTALEELLSPEVLLSAPGEDLHFWDTFKNSLSIFGIEIDTTGTVGDRHFARLKTTEMALRAKEIYKALRPSKTPLSFEFQLLLAEKDRGKGWQHDGRTIDKHPLPHPLTKGPFRLQSYRLLSVSSISINSGENVDDFVLSSKEKSTIILGFKPYYEPGTDTIRLEDLKMVRISPHPRRSSKKASTRLLETTLNIRAGDTVIAGTSRSGGLSYVLVITVKRLYSLGDE